MSRFRAGWPPPAFLGMTGTDGSLALDNLEAVLTAGDMTLADVVRLNVYTPPASTTHPQLLALVEASTVD